MVRVQFPHPSDRSDKFWVLFKREPAFVDIENWRVDHDDPSAASIASGLVPFFGICLLGVEPRVSIFRKRVAPAVREIKDRHVEYEHGVVPGRAWSKELAQRAPEIVFTWFGFHFGQFCLVPNPRYTRAA